MRAAWAVVGSMLMACSAHAAVVFQDLGTAAPPAVLGGITVAPFSLAAQRALPITPS